MKQLLSLLFLLAIGTVALQAQTEKGNFALGLHNFSPGGVTGSSSILSPASSLGIAFGKSKSKANDGDFEDQFKYSVIGLNLSGHYFVINGLSVGLVANVFGETQKELDDDKDKYQTSIFLAGPELRYYAPIGGKSKFWVKGSGAVGKATNKVNGEKDDDPTKLTQFGGGAGLAFFPNSHISLDLGLGYNVFVSKNESTFGTVTNEYTDVYSGLAFDLGFTIFL
jgi:opacity protein-like surface antigen